MEKSNGEVLVVSIVPSKKKWILDLGCAFHMSSRIDWFVPIKELNGGDVFLGDNNTTPITGIRNI